MKIARRLIEAAVQDSEKIIQSFTELIDAHDLNVQVDAVDVFANGSVVISFVDEDEFVEVMFTHDEDLGGPVAYIIEDEEGKEEVELVDLNPDSPKLITLPSGDISINLMDLSWLSENTLFLILDNAEMDEKTAFVIRDGKKVKKKLVRKKKKKILTPKQKAGVRKATRSRRAKKGQIARKRKKSLKIRKRMGIKKSKDKSFKVQGTSGHR